MDRLESAHGFRRRGVPLTVVATAALVHDSRFKRERQPPKRWPGFLYPNPGVGECLTVITWDEEWYVCLIGPV